MSVPQFHTGLTTDSVLCKGEKMYIKYVSLFVFVYIKINLTGAIEYPGEECNLQGQVQAIAVDRVY